MKLQRISSLLGCLMVTLTACPDDLRAQNQPAAPAETPSGKKVISSQEFKRLIAEKLAAKADPEVIKLLLDQARSAEEISRDPLASREDFEKLLEETEEIRKMTADVREATVGDLVDQSPTDGIELIVNRTLNRLKARLGGHGGAGGDSSPEDRLGQPIPEFSESPLLRERVLDLRDAQSRLREVLAKDSEKQNPAERDERITGMILAQEELAWEAGWPFTAEEVEKIKAAEGDKIPEAVYLSRLKRGLEAINAQLEKERSSTGRGAPPGGFALHHPEDEDLTAIVSKSVGESRGHPDAWKTLAKPFDEAARDALHKPGR